jgi:hypothetical protein
VGNEKRVPSRLRLKTDVCRRGLRGGVPIVEYDDPMVVSLPDIYRLGVEHRLFFVET